MKETGNTRGRFYCVDKETQGDGSIVLTNEAVYSIIIQGDYYAKTCSQKKRKRNISYNASRN